MRLPPIPQPWPLSPESAWREFYDALAHVTDSQAGFWRTQAARELARIGRCRSSPAQPLQHAVVPVLDELHMGRPPREA